MHLTSLPELRARGREGPLRSARRIGHRLLADSTQTGQILGTPCYTAPEQAGGRAHEVGPAADIYALGAILYECLTGRTPFRGETPWDTIEQVLNQDPLPPSRLRHMTMASDNIDYWIDEA